MLVLAIAYIGVDAQTIRDRSLRRVVSIENGLIRDSHRTKIGSISKDGVVRDDSGRCMGRIKADRVIDAAGRTQYLWDRNGRIRDTNGATKWRVRVGGEVRNASGRILYRFEALPLQHVVAYLCFFSVR